MTLSELKSAQNPVIDTLHIYSHEGGIYTLQATIDGKSQPLQLNKDKPAVHDSIEGIRLKMDGVHVREAYLVQQTPYDEMIGLPSTGGIEKQPIAWV